MHDKCTRVFKIEDKDKFEYRYNYELLLKLVFVTSMFISSKLIFKKRV